MSRLLLMSCICSFVLSAPVLGQNDKKPPATPAASTPVPPPKKEPKPADRDSAEAAAWAKAAEPGPQHKLLEQFEGEWTAAATEFGPDGAQSGSGTGTMTSKMVLGGRFLSMDYDGRMHGRFFRGMGMLGYSNVDKQFECAWSDSMSTSLSVLNGQADKAGKVFTLVGEYTDPLTGKRAKQKEVLTITSKDSHKAEFFMQAGGKEVRVMEVVYTRAKGDAASKDDKAKKADKPEPKPAPK